MSSADSDSDIDYVGVKIAGDVQTDTVCDVSDPDVDYCGFATIGGNATSALLPPVLEQLVHLSDKIGRSSKNGSGNTMLHPSGQNGNTLPSWSKCD